MLESGRKTRVKMPDKLRALELHAKLSGALPDKPVPAAEVHVRVTIGG